MIVLDLLSARIAVVPYTERVESRGGERAAAPLSERFSGTGRDMAIFLITGAIAGIILGLRFKVLVVVPAILLATVIIIVSGSGDKLSVIVLTVVGTAVSLQIGYIVGSILRALARAYLPARMRVGCRRSGSQPTR